MRSQRRLLFILDLNGTLLHRLCRRPELRAYYDDHPNCRPADCRFGGNHLIFRPNRQVFLERLFKLGQVAVWTSAMTKNALPMVIKTFDGILDLEYLRQQDPSFSVVMNRQRDLIQGVKTGSERLLFLWTQTECIVKQLSTSYKPEFLKDLDRVWQHFPEYGPHNTIMVDDSVEKLARHRDNLLQIPEYIVTDAKIDFTQDVVLSQMLQTLERTQEECHHKDIRPLLREYRIEDHKSD